MENRFIIKFFIFLLLTDKIMNNQGDNSKENYFLAKNLLKKSDDIFIKNINTGKNKFKYNRYK